MRHRGERDLRSDTKQIFLHGALDNPLTALLSFPHVLGHEVVARAADSRPPAVVLNPWLSCVPRGIAPPCARPPAGTPGAATSTAAWSPALHLGNCATPRRALERCSPRTRASCSTSPTTMSDDTAVLADPASVSLRTILLHPPDPSTPALVYGCGTLALAAVGLLRHLYPDVEVWVVSRPGPPGRARTPHGARTRSCVATRRPRGGGRRGRRVRPLVPWSSTRGFRTAPASSTTRSGARRRWKPRCDSSRPAGAGRQRRGGPKRFEWTPLYFKELHVIGSNAFGVEEVGGVRKHAFEHYFDFVGDGLDLTPIITHRFPFDEWKRAVLTIARRKRTGAVKVLLEQ